MPSILPHPGRGDEVACYAVPGLGASSKLFEKLDLPPWIRVCPVEWAPCEHNESIAHYARRLLPQVDSTRPHIYVGFSFGAAVAVELAKLTNPIMTVLISGVATRDEIPFYLRRLRALGAYNLAPLVVRIWEPLLRWGAGFAFGTRDPEALDLLVHMIRHIEPTFYECGLKSFMGWKNSEPPPHLLHIHGRSDKLLPARYVRPDLLIPKGGHFIVYTHGEQIGRIIAAAVVHRRDHRATLVC